MRSNHISLFITLSLLIIIFFITACNSLEEIDPPYQLASDPINSSQFGFIIQDKEWLYYMDGQRNNNISRTDGILTQTYENTYGRGIQIHGDYLYYAPYGGDSGLYRVHTEIPDKIEKIIDVYISSYVIANDYIIYATSPGPHSGIYRADIKGEKNVQLEDEMINHFQWQDGWIYYAISSGGKVLRMNTAGKEKTELTTEMDIPISTTNFIVVGDWLYFQNRDDYFFIHHPPKKAHHNNIYRLNLNDKRVESVAEGRLKNYLPDGPYIIFSDENQLKKMDINGGKQTLLYDGYTEWHWVNQINNLLYFIDWNPDNVDHVYYFDSENFELKMMENAN